MLFQMQDDMREIIHIWSDAIDQILVEFMQQCRDNSIQLHDIIL